MRARIVVRQPAVGIDAVEYIIGDVECEIKVLTVVLDVSGKRKILRFVVGVNWAIQLATPVRRVASEYSPRPITPSILGVRPR